MDTIAARKTENKKNTKEEKKRKKKKNNKKRRAPETLLKGCSQNRNRIQLILKEWNASSGTGMDDQSGDEGIKNK